MKARQAKVVGCRERFVVCFDDSLEDRGPRSSTKRGTVRVLHLELIDGFTNNEACYLTASTYTITTTRDPTLDPLAFGPSSLVYIGRQSAPEEAGR